MKAKQFFGGTNPKATGEPGKRVGSSSSTSDIHANVSNRGAADTKAYKPKTGKFSRPNIPGKVDNRKVGH